jgi:hypothetical protein
MRATVEEQRRGSVQFCQHRIRMSKTRLFPMWLRRQRGDILPVHFFSSDNLSLCVGLNPFKIPNSVLSLDKKRLFFC